MAYGKKPIYNCPNCGPVWQVVTLPPVGRLPETTHCGSCNTTRLTLKAKKGVQQYHYLTRAEKQNLPDGTPDNMSDELNNEKL